MTATNEPRDREILVVGGGAAGILAAKRAADAGAKITLLEKNDRLGMKILISGGGKCNLTHDGSIEEIRAVFRPNEARFLTPSLHRFTNEDFLTLLHRSGMPTYVRPDGRVFPVEPFDAKDVVALLLEMVRGAGVTVQTKTPVSGLVVEGGQIAGVRIRDQIRRAQRVIVAVGGSSYPATGTTGDGWRWVSELGHTVVALRAALAPLYLQHAEPDWSGIALRDIILRARDRDGGKEYARWRGDLLFTHKGLSGPCALGISRKVAETIASGVPFGGKLEVDLAPDLPFEALQAQFRLAIKDNPRKTVSSIIEGYVPHRIEEPFATTAGTDLQMRGANLPAKLLNKLVSTLKGWPIGGVRSVPLERGEVVAGGVSLEEVDPKTMESRRVKGLYLCGEILDIAGPVGGYNLQAAWSTGYVAGESAANAG